MTVVRLLSNIITMLECMPIKRFCLKMSEVDITIETDREKWRKMRNDIESILTEIVINFEV